MKLKGRKWWFRSCGRCFDVDNDLRPTSGWKEWKPRKRMK